MTRRKYNFVIGCEVASLVILFLVLINILNYRFLILMLALFIYWLANVKNLAEYDNERNRNNRRNQLPY